MRIPIILVLVLLSLTACAGGKGGGSSVEVRVFTDNCSGDPERVTGTALTDDGTIVDADSTGVSAEGAKSITGIGDDGGTLNLSVQGDDSESLDATTIEVSIDGTVLSTFTPDEGASFPNSIGCECHSDGGVCWDLTASTGGDFTEPWKEHTLPGADDEDDGDDKE